MAIVRTVEWKLRCRAEEADAHLRQGMQGLVVLTDERLFFLEKVSVVKRSNSST